MNPQDTPRKMVIDITQPLTNAEAIELGKVLGKAGFTGVFTGGEVAELAALGARCRKEQERKRAGEKGREA